MSGILAAQNWCRKINPSLARAEVTHGMARKKKPFEQEELLPFEDLPESTAPGIKITL